MRRVGCLVGLGWICFHTGLLHFGYWARQTVSLRSRGCQGRRFPAAPLSLMEVPQSVLDPVAHMEGGLLQVRRFQNQGSFILFFFRLEKGAHHLMSPGPKIQFLGLQCVARLISVGTQPSLDFLVLLNILGLLFNRNWFAFQSKRRFLFNSLSLSLSLEGKMGRCVSSSYRSSSFTIWGFFSCGADCCLGTDIWPSCTWGDILTLHCLGLNNAVLHYLLSLLSITTT